MNLNSNICGLVAVITDKVTCSSDVNIVTISNSNICGWVAGGSGDDEVGEKSDRDNGADELQGFELLVVGGPNYKAIVEVYLKATSRMTPCTRNTVTHFDFAEALEVYRETVGAFTHEIIREYRKVQGCCGAVFSILRMGSCIE